jgi:hypothetical protein
MTLRRSYAGQETYSENQSSGPILIEPSTRISKQSFDRLGFFKRDSLVLSRFLSTDTTLLMNPDSKDNVELLTGFKEDHSNYIITLRFSGGKDSPSLSFAYSPGTSFKIAIADLIPGGFQEVLVMKSLYFMNGDVFNVYVYEIQN